MGARRWRSSAPALNGSEAFDLVITDKAMPHLSGERLAAEIKALAPQTRVILLTGYGAPTDETLAVHIDLVVDKPVTREALRQAVARVMAEKTESVLEPEKVGREFLGLARHGHQAVHLVH